VKFTHLNEDGAAYMVDVTAKNPTVRQASAVCRVDCSPEVMLLPLAHTIGVHGCAVDLSLEDDHVAIRATVRTADRTGVEMEALTSVTVAALAIVDMVKGVDRSARIREAKIVAKSGGRSGDWVRPEDPQD